MSCWQGANLLSDGISFDEVQPGEQRRTLMSLLLLADPNAALVEDYLDQGRLFVIRYQGRCLAEALVIFWDESSCELKNMAVAPDFQHHGLGTRLLEHVFGQCAKLGYREICVGTSESARSFYERLGFQYVRTITNFFVDHYPEPIWDKGVQCVDMLLFRKELPPQG